MYSETTFSIGYIIYIKDTGKTHDKSAWRNRNVYSGTTDNSAVNLDELEELNKYI